MKKCPSRSWLGHGEVSGKSRHAADYGDTMMKNERPDPIEFV